MSQQFVTVWLAGLMMGAGAGLLLSRCGGPVVTAESREVARENTVAMSAAQSAASLFDPRTFSEPPPLQRPESGDSFRLHPASTPFEPRLLPEGDASPVPEPTAGKHVGRAGAKSLAMQTPQESPFRTELQLIAPGFSEVALEELESLRTMIEAEAPLGLTRELADPSAEIAPVSGTTSHKKQNAETALPAWPKGDALLPMQKQAPVAGDDQPIAAEITP